MAPRRAKVNKVDYKKLSVNDVICPLCRSILIKPITLPCSHGFCASCFETTTQNANLVCPLCRVRVGSWVRSAKKSKKLINEEFWKAIQVEFGQQVRNKVNGLNDNVTKDEGGDRNNSLVKRKANATALKQNKQQNTKNVATAGKKPQNSVEKANNQSVDCGKVTNNFAMKEYTCRILCQSADSKESMGTVNESLKKNKRIQKIAAEAESQNSRSNSIESECLYFKPIDYRHNPPSEGLAPIKVPTRKPNVSTNTKILAPCGQNQININPQKSAFVHLFSTELLKDKLGTCKKENVVRQEQVPPPKRKLVRIENKYKKKLKCNHKPVESEESGATAVHNINDFGCSPLNNVVKKTTNVRLRSLVSAKNLAKSLQEKADFELATKLQQTYDQYSKYLTRSSVVKRMTSKNQVRMGDMMSYKVK